MSEVYFETGDETFEQEVLRSERPVLVDFWAPWCGPCLMMAPAFESLAEEYQGRLGFAKLNVDDNLQVSTQYAVFSIPTLILFKGGQEIERLVGLQGRGALQRRIEGVLEPQA
jgi:thioredoxin 1